MTTLFLLALGIAVILTVAYWRWSLPLWSLALLVYAAVVQVVVGYSLVLLLALWVPLLAVLLLLNLAPLRRRLLTGPAFAWFRRVLPPVSATEREAIDAGNVWWDAELFSGKPRWQRLLKTPPPTLSPEEKAFLEGPTETLCQMLDTWDIHHHRNDLPEEAWRFIRENGFLGMIIPRSHGGLEFSAQANSAVVMKLASRSQTAAVTVMVPNSLGPGELLMHFGTDAQKSHYLPRLASGEEIPCFALTGPYAGSDAAGMPDRGIVCRGEYRGEEVLGLRVSWDKRYITLAPVATVLGLAIRVQDPDGLLGAQEELGITCCLIPTTTAGVEIGTRHLPVGSAFLNGPTRGEDVFIPMDHVIGGQERIGQGWRMLMYCLAAGRAISLPALGTAGAKLSCAVSSAYARVRKQFKLPIGRFEGIAEVLARMAGETYRMDAARRLTLVALDQGEKPVVLSAILKYHLTEGYRRAVIDAMDVHGGKGIIEGPNNYLATVYQGLPVAITVEGANILTRSLIIFGQGAIRCHPYLLEEMAAAAEEDREAGLKHFDQAMTAHVGYTISNKVRALLLGLTGARLTRSPASGPTAHYYRQLKRMSAAFAILADLSLLILGGKLKFKESLSGRFADMLSHLYMASAVLKRHRDDGSPSEDLPLVRYALDDGLYRIQDALEGILDNFPSPIIGRMARALVLPWGRPYRRPADALVHEVAQLLLSDSPTRRRLIGGIHLTTSTDDAAGRVEDAFLKVLAAEGSEGALSNALKIDINPLTVEEAVATGLSTGVITEEQAEQLRAAQAAVAQVIAVDDFPAQPAAGESAQTQKASA